MIEKEQTQTVVRGLCLDQQAREMSPQTSSPTKPFTTLPNLFLSLSISLSISQSCYR